MLKVEAESERLSALVSSLTVAGNAVLRWRGILNLLSKLRNPNLETLNALLRHKLSLGAAISAASGAFDANRRFREIDRLSRRLENLRAQSESAVELMEDLVRSYVNGNCHLTNNLS